MFLEVSIERCKYCGRPSYGYCCPSCWDDFERGGEIEDDEWLPEFDDEDDDCGVGENGDGEEA